jgi:molybdopterin-guanine dinucleotide biosynthesis protein A
MGSPKEWLPIGAERFLPRIVRIISEVVQPVIVAAAHGQDLPSLPTGVEVVRDRRDDCGPLEGLATGLRAMQQLGLDTAYVSSTDVPFLEPAFVCQVLSQLENAWVAVPFVSGRLHPMAAVYRATCLPAIDRLLDSGRFRPTFLFDEVLTRRIDASQFRGIDPRVSLRNVNSPEDYELAVHDFAVGNSASTTG